MKSRIILIAIALAVAVGAWAGRVGEKAALKKASAFMSNHARTRGAGTLTRVYLPLETKSPIWSATDAPLYVFNKDGGGYVVVSGDDRTADILCFSDQGHIDANNLPVNMKSWLQGYVRQIESIPASAIPQRVTTTRTGDTKEPLETKMKTAWDQEYPYNLHTPKLTFRWKDKDTTIHSATGCAATAMAMVMHYYKYPSELKTSIPSYEGTCDIPVKAKETGKTDTVKNVKWQTEDIPAGTAIPWGYITDIYDEQSSDIEKDAVARLMQYCGAAINIKYGLKSGSNVLNLLRGVYGVMDYQDVYILNAFEYDEQGWVDAVYHEMSKAGPVLFSGFSPTNGGHSFVLDGYQSAEGKDYFYANWGWSGRHNGYVLLSVMESGQFFDANGNPEGFINEQSIICGLGPHGKGCTTVPHKFHLNNFELGLEGKEYSRSEKKDSFQIGEYKIVYYNYHLIKLTSRIAVGVYDAKKKLVSITYISNEEGTTLSYGRGESISNAHDVINYFPIGGGLDDGVYTVMPICSEPYTENWEPMQNVEKYVLTMNVTGNTCTFKPAGTTAIRNIMADADKANTNNTWYSLSGAHLPSKPTTKGVFIHQGRKYKIN